MNVLIKPIFGAIYKKNKFFEVNSDVNIFYGFKKKLDEFGVSVNTLDIESEKKEDHLVFFDIPFFWEIKYIFKLLMNRKKSTLFVFEPPIINPFDHWKFFYRFFHSVYTWNDNLVDNKKIKKFYLPVLNPNSETKKLSFNEKKFLSMINSNKAAVYPLVALSPYKKELYSERLNAIDFFEKNLPNEFDLYGKGWNKPKKLNLKEKMFGYKKYKSYKGSLSSVPGVKLKLISKYKFNLCFENCIVAGYISEKIIDCFKASTVPVYLGAPNVEKYIPKNCFIDFRDFSDYSSLLIFLKSIRESEYNNYIKNGQKLLKSKRFRSTWFEEGFLEKFLESISYDKNAKITPKTV